MGGVWAIAPVVVRIVQGPRGRRPGARRLPEAQGQSRPCCRSRVHHLHRQRRVRLHCLWSVLLVRRVLSLCLRPRLRLFRHGRRGSRGRGRRCCRDSHRWRRRKGI